MVFPHPQIHVYPDLQNTTLFGIRVFASVRICLPKQETQKMQVPALGQEDPLEKEMATCSNTLAWKIPQTEVPGGLQSIGLQSQTQLSD